MKTLYRALIVLLLLSPQAVGSSERDDIAELSPQTQACIGCHATYTPGIVEDWMESRHARKTPAEALRKPALERRISAETVSADLSKFAVGCYECHSRNPERHRDNFEHMGFKINIVVSPADCSACHPLEYSQFSRSKKAHAIGNLMNNPVYHTLVDDVTGIKKFEGGRLTGRKPTESALHDTCLGCHGTRVEVRGMKTVSSDMGEVTVPNLANWPNQGVGRENPDGSFGACTACHARHAFSIEVARKPYTCSQCHHEPDVPAWNVYEESKHGNIYSSKGHKWDMSAVPWVVGKDFQAPTCATCHNSLVVSPSGGMIAERSHDFGSRLWVRVFGLIYAHPQPKSGDTTVIRNREGLPLPTTFVNEAATDFLIDAKEQERRLGIMKKVCSGCHSTQWTNSHFEKLANTVSETNEMTLTATQLMADAWGRGVEDRSNPFDEAIEKLWIKQWLFYSNTIRYASAMTGAPDYTSFKLGWWELSDNLQKMKDLIEMKHRLLFMKGQQQEPAR